MKINPPKIVPALDEAVVVERTQDEAETPVCRYCNRTEKECEEQVKPEDKDNGNPVTDWCGGWGVSCDECYYKNHPEIESDDEDIN